VAAYENIGSGARTAKYLIRQTASTPLPRRVIRYHHEQVVVAMGVGISASNRPKKINPLRPIRLHQSAYRLGKYGVVWGRRLKCSRVAYRHSLSPKFATVTVSAPRISVLVTATESVVAIEALYG
jgi:hypothetical protein